MILIKKNKNNYSKILDKWLDLKKGKIKEQSYIKYTNFIKLYINPYLGNLNYKTINETDLNTFFNNPNIAKLAISSQRTLIFIIKSSLKFCIDRNLRRPIKTSDLKFKKPKAKLIYFTKEEQSILERYLEKEKDIRKLGILICLYTGIRLGEVCGLKWEDIDFKNKVLYINRTVLRIKNNDKNATTKTKRIISTPKSESSKRVIPLPDFLIHELKKYQSKENYFILTNTDSFKDNRVYEKYFENVLKKCDIRKLNFHTLRHTFATRCIESGMDIKTLSEILGHSSYHITLDIYVHSTIDQKRNCINNLVNYIKPVVEY